MGQYRIEGKVYEAPDAAAAYKSHAEAAQVPGYFSGLLQHLNQGISVGTSDEMYAGLERAMGNEGDFDKSMARQKIQRNNFAKKYPLSSGTATGIGAILPIAASTIAGLAGAPASGGTSLALPVATSAKVLPMIMEAFYGGGKAVQAANTLPQMMIAGAKSGFFPGAVAGTATADPGSRGYGTVTGAAYGTGLGATVGAAGNLIPKAYGLARGGVSAVDDYLANVGMPNRTMANDAGSLNTGGPTPPRSPYVAPAANTPMPTITTAESKILSAMEDAGISPQDALGRLQRANELGVPLGVVDVMGTPGQRLARGVRGAGGEAGNIVESNFQKRAAEQSGRLVKSLERATGRRASGNVEATIENLWTQARDQSSPFYRQLSSLPEITSNNMDEIFRTDAVRDLIRAGENTTNRWLKPSVGRVRSLYDAEGNLTRRPTFNDVDFIKQTLDEMLSPLYQRTPRPGSPVDVSTRLPQGLANDTRIDMLRTADAAPGGDVYANARQSFAGPAQAADAVEAGRAFTSPTTNTYAVQREMATPIGQRKWYQRGAIDALRTDIRKVPDLGNQPNRLRKFWGDIESREKLDALIPNQERRTNLRDSLALENEAAQASNFVRGGSPTTDKAVDVADVADLVENMAPEFLKGPKSLVGKIIAQTYGSLTSSVNKANRVEIAQTLTNFTDPQTQFTFLRRLQLLQDQGRLNSQTISSAAKSLTTAEELK